jgi:hypothetical protein
MVFYDEAGQNPNHEAANNIDCERANWKSPVYRMVMGPGRQKISENRAYGTAQSNDQD